MEEKYCRNCGKRLRDDAGFCENCGHKKNNDKKEKVNVKQKKNHIAVSRQQLLILVAVLFVGVAGALFALNQINNIQKKHNTGVDQSALNDAYKTEEKENTPTIKSTVPPTPSPSPKQTQPNESLGNYSIQLGAFSKKENAENCIAKAQNAGFLNLRMQLITRNGRNLYHVIIYGFQDIQAANERLDKVQKSGFDDAFVTKN